MKLINTTKSNTEFEAKFDIGLIKGIDYDEEEDIYKVDYDASDVGLPLGFHGSFYETYIFVKITDKTVYADLCTELGESDLEKSLYSEEGMADFRLVLTEEEKVELLIQIIKLSVN